MELTSFQQILKSFHQIKEKPPTLEPLIDLYVELTRLPHEEFIAEVKSIGRILSKLRSYEIVLENLYARRSDPLPPEQWRSIHKLVTLELVQSVAAYDPKEYTKIVADINQPRFTIADIIEKLPQPDTLKRYRVDLSKLDSQIVTIIFNLLNELSHDVVTSGVTVPILEYFNLITALSVDRPELPTLLEPIQKILQSHGWTDGGFYSAPNRVLLLEDLHSVIDKGLDSYREYVIQEKKSPLLSYDEEEEYDLLSSNEEERELVSSIVSGLIDNIAEAGPVNAVKEYLETLSILSETDPDATSQLESVDKLLQKYGWQGDSFEGSVDSDLLRKELKDTLCSLSQ